MCAYKDNSDLEQSRKREYLKQQHQLRTMTKTTSALSADDMIENLLSRKEIFKMKKDAANPSKPKTLQAFTPHWLISGQEPALYKRVWDIVGTPTGYADTPKLTNILLTSRLSTDVLGYIWSLSNSNLGPALLQQDTYTALALVALAQNGYGFTSSAVLNTLKEAPIPKLELNFNEFHSVLPGMTMAKPEPMTPPTMSSLATIVTPGMGLPQVQSFSNPQVLTVSSEFASKSTTPIATTPTVPISPAIPTINSSSVNLLANSLNLLDLDIPSSSGISMPEPSSASAPISLLDDNSLVIPTENNVLKDKKDPLPRDPLKGSVNDIILKSHTVSNENSFAAKNTKVQSPSLGDDLFGEFQSVQFPEENNTVNEEIEFDDFKSADFTSLSMLEVKEKPPEPEISVVKSPTIHHESSSANIEDLFPKCVVKPKEETIDLIAEEEDKYSALRGLTTVEDHDEFGDFLTATPSQPKQPSLLLPPLAEYQANIQERAMEACLGILEEARKIFLSIEEVEVLNEVISDPKGIQYLEELIEVQRIAQRLQVALNKEEYTNKLEDLSKSLLQYLEPHKNSYMEEEVGPKCGICLSEKGPAYVKYGINNFHAPCANLYLHKVDSSLPIAPVM